MRVLILGIYHDPEPIPKTGELARELQRRGHDVQVVTAFPHYPSGRLYPGYRLRPWMREVRDGVPVLRTYIYPYHGTRSALRMLNYVTWMLSSMLAAVLTPPADVLYVWHPPLTVGVSAWVISRLKRIPFLYDVQDLWPESALASGLMRPGRLASAMFRLAGWVYARAPRIFVVSEQARGYLASRGVPAEKLRVASHWFDAEPFDAPAPARRVAAELGVEGRFVAMFAGNLGLVQGLETVVEAAALLRQDPRIVVAFVGDGADRARLEDLVRTRGLTNVVFAGARPAAAMPAFLRAADALIVHVRPSTVADHAIPTKTLAYMASGRPIVAGIGGAGADVVRAAGGSVVAPGDAAALAGAIARLAEVSPAARQEMGRAARAYFDAHFTRDRIIDFYERELLELARQGRRPRPRVSRRAGTA